ncbi:MAG: hypothetical protein JXB50_11495 [Spirochaetes bacterium]|nr:hypothetical protein [Spirochaetota bacterium]
MILSNKKYLYFFLFISLVLLLLFNIAFYNILMKMYDKYNDQLMKFYAENFIYYLIISFILVFIVFIFIFIRSNNIDKTLDKIIEMSKNSDADIADFFNKIGSIGNKINYLTGNLREVSRSKSLRIQTYWNIINFMFEKFENGVLMIEHDGFIVNASRDIFSEINIENKEIIKNNINFFLEDFNFSEVKDKLVQQKNFLTLNNIKFTVSNKTAKINLTFVPIFNIDGIFVYTLAVKNAEENIMRQKIIVQETPPKKQKSGLRKVIDHIKKNIKIKKK